MKEPEMLFTNVTELSINTLGGEVVVRGCQGKAFRAGAARKLLGMIQETGRNAPSASGGIDIEIFKEPHGAHGERVG